MYLRIGYWLFSSAKQGLQSGQHFAQKLIKVEMMLRFHKLENFLSLFISVNLGVILL